MLLNEPSRAGSLPPWILPDAIFLEFTCALNSHCLCNEENFALCFSNTDMSLRGALPMTIRSVMFAAPWLLAAALSSPMVMASGDEKNPVQKPECPKGQVWDSKTQKCVLLTSLVLPGANVLTSIHQAPEHP